MDFVTLAAQIANAPVVGEGTNTVAEGLNPCAPVEGLIVNAPAQVPNIKTQESLHQLCSKHNLLQVHKSPCSLG